MARVVTPWERFKERMYPFFILLALLLSIYSLVVQIYFLRPDPLSGLELTYLSIQTFLVFMATWCFLKTFFTDPGVPPLFWVAGC